MSDKNYECKTSFSCNRLGVSYVGLYGSIILNSVLKNRVLCTQRIHVSQDRTGFSENRIKDLDSTKRENCLSSSATSSSMQVNGQFRIISLSIA
jgi:hypothetical protein